jgi:hypothetical protein
MVEAADKIQSFEPVFDSGKIVLDDGSVFMVQINGSIIPARQAASCLIKPATGDTVLLFIDKKEITYVLAVLKRKETDKPGTNIILEGQVSLHVNNGTLSLTADRDVVLASGNRLDVSTSNYCVHAEKGDITIERLSIVSRLIHGQVKTIRMVAVYAETICRRLTQRLENAYRFVKKHDEVQSHTARYLAEETFTVHAKNTVQMAEQNVIINAEQIHLS